MTAGLTKGQRSPIGPLGKLSQGPQANGDLSKRGVGLGRGPNQMAKTPNAAWTQAWPAPGSTLDLDFANNRGWVRGVGQGGVMDAITFTRASNGTYVGPDGLLAGAGSDKGALGKNLLTFPQDFDNAAWTKSSATITPNVMAAPDGTQTADLVTITGIAPQVYQDAVVNNTSATVSAYFKKGSSATTSNALVLRNQTLGTNIVAARVDLDTGAITYLAGSSGATSVYIGDGWWRLILTGSITSGNTVRASILGGYSAVSGQYSFIWGAQLETGSSATTYFPTNINTPRFDWASTTALAQVNLLTYTEQFDNAAWGSANTGGTGVAPVVTANAALAPDGTMTADRIVFSLGGGTTTADLSRRRQVTTASNFVSGTGTFSFWARTTDGVSSVNILRENSDGFLGSQQITVTGTWQRFSITSATYVVGSSVGLGLRGGQTPVMPNTADILVWGAQLETGSSATTYQAVAQPTTNTPLAATSTSNGLLIEESRANALLWCRDATNAAWVKTNMTAALNQTGIDGVANAASSLTATNANATCIQTITAASASKTGSVYLKRITGTGTVQVSLDGTTYSTVDLSNGLWNRVVLSGTVTNPVVGIKIVTSGDAVAMDYGQVEAGAFVTTPIYTTTASATRAQDLASMSIATIAPMRLYPLTVEVNGFSNKTSGVAPYYTLTYNTNTANVCGVAQQTSTGLVTNGGGDGNLVASPFNVGVGGSFALSRTRGSVSLAVNGQAVFSNSSGTTELFNIIWLGSDQNGGNYLNGCLKRVSMFPFRSTASALLDLSGQST